VASNSATADVRNFPFPATNFTRDSCISAAYFTLDETTKTSVLAEYLGRIDGGITDEKGPLRAKVPGGVHKVIVMREGERSNFSLNLTVTGEDE